MSHDWRSLPLRALSRNGSAASSAALYASAGHDGLTDREWPAAPGPSALARVPPCPPQTPAPALEHKAEPGGAAEKN
jgi:hypothetical protein